MREAGKLAAEVLEMIGDYIKPGVSTGELDKICNDYIVEVQKAIPANVGYRGFEKTLCTSINQVICHGIPDFNRILKNGDIMNIDVTVIKDGCSTIVKGPGQNFSATVWASELHIAKACICSIEKQWIMSGLKLGRPFA